MKLFSDVQRTYSGRANHDSSTYEFLDKSTWPAAAYLRTKVGEWALTFPLDNDFVKRFTSKVNKQHDAAFFEIVIHQLLQKQGFKVDFQQLVSVVSGKRPDFTLSQDESICAYAECTLSAMPDSIESNETLKNQITDYIENIHSPDYFINIEYESCNSKTISKKNILPFIETMLATGQEKPIHSLTELKKWTFIDSGWRINFSLLPKTQQSSRTLGAVESSDALGIINSERPLRTALDRKRGKNYGQLDKPYVVCINSADIYLDDLSIIQTLFGFSSESEFAEASHHNSKGFYINRGKAQNTSVSAVLIAKNLVPWNLHVVELSVWHNPWAKFPLKQDTFSLNQNLFTRIGNHFKREILMGESLGKVLNIDPSYMSKGVEE